jgi:hypothetical protein
MNIESAASGVVAQADVAPKASNGGTDLKKFPKQNHE